MNVICHECGEQFQAKRLDARYCSDKCRADAFRARQRAADEDAIRTLLNGRFPGIAPDGKKVGQRERILAQLLARGARGLTEADCHEPRGPDGLGRIGRAAPRVEELRDGGIEIQTLRDPNGCGRYVLTQLAVPHIPGGKEAPDGASPPSAPPPCAEQAVAGEPALFDPAAYARPGLMDAA